jgi:hypothetical protein
MATEDANNKNTSGKKFNTTKNEDELKDKNEVSDKATDKKKTTADEETGTTPVAADSENTAEDDSNKTKNLTPEEVEEESIMYSNLYIYHV